ncbi:MAG TPA: tRNA pseudouridine(55) synthase TruB [Micavibrio sp.]|jgi:tRNA pseudouridine55 synthase
MSRHKKGIPINGWIALDKPAGMTSTQAVGKVRRIMNAQKIGHGGTLDPLATGILPIALGEATKTIPYIQDHLKTYIFTVQWGEQRSTDDMEGEVIATSAHRPSQQDIENILSRFTGEIMQTPPQFSAIKIDGERAYDIAREGGTVDLKPRLVYVESLELIPQSSSRKMRSVCPGFRPPQDDLTARTPDQVRGDGSEIAGEKADATTFRCVCGKGTYIRSLGRDMALSLGSVGYISALRRENVGPLGPGNAISLEKLEENHHSALLPVDTVLDGIPALPIHQQEAARLKQGQALSFISRPDAERLRQAGIEIGPEPITALAVYDGNPVALVTIEGIDIWPLRVLNL